MSTSPETAHPQTVTAGHGDISVGVKGASGSGEATASATRITPGNALRPEDIALAVSRGTAKPDEDVAEFALRLGDDALILAQRLGHWISRAPELEEDIALGNIALDQLGHARSFLSYAGGLGRQERGRPRLLPPRARVPLASQIFEQPERRLRRHHRPPVRRQLLPVRALPPADAVHRRHPRRHRREGRQGSGLPPRPQRPVGAAARPGHRRVPREDDPRLQGHLALRGRAVPRRRLTARLSASGAAVEPSSLRADFDRLTGEVLAEADLDVPKVQPAPGGGRKGLHSEHLGYLLAEMQVLAREYPGASW